MKNSVIIAFSAALIVGGCGPGKPGSGVEPSRNAVAKAQEPGPEYESVGVISSLEGRNLTLDHEGAIGSGLVAGRNTFIAYADVLAEAPITPGSRVAFEFHRTAEGLELTQLKAR